MKYSILKLIFIGLGSLVGMVLLATVGYVIYLQANYYRIEDGQVLAVQNNQHGLLQTGTDYTAATYNIGFGAYNHAFSFFMDSGVMDDGSEVSGSYARAQSPEIVRENTDGAARTMQMLNADFYLLQEVDVKSTRSFGIDQVAALSALFGDYGATYASNFHSVYLAYPLHEMHGSVQAGLMTMSRYQVSEAVRRSYPVDNSFVTKFFDLDRCFSLHRLPVEGGRELVLINSHMSAYDEGGLIRQKQMDFLAAVLTEEAEKGNYVIVGGDFNQALGDTVEAFSSQQQVPAWVHTFANDKLPQGYRVVEAQNLTKTPTCRSTDMPYEKGVNYTTVLDGFIVSENITAEAHNVDTEFQFSDHNPVQLVFRLQ